MLPSITCKHLWQAGRMLLAFGLAWLAAWLVGLKEIYWALITSIIVIQPGMRDTLSIGRDRIVGTIIGSMAGLLIIEAGGHGLPTLVLFCAALGPLALLTSIWPNMRISCITLIILILVPSSGPEFARPLDRVAEILVGTLASLAAAMAVRLMERPGDPKAVDD